MKILVVSANIGSSCKNEVVKQKGLNVDFKCLSDHKRNKAIGKRLNGKIPKMLAWDLYPGYDVYMWMDSHFSLKKENSMQWFLDQLGDKDAVFFKHPSRDSVKKEVDFILKRMKEGDQYLKDRCEGEPMLEQVNSYLKDSSYIDNKLFACGIFLYKKELIENKENNVMKEWFYHNCRWSIRDQLSLPYLLQKYKVNYNIINEHIIKCITTK